MMIPFTNSIVRAILLPKCYRLIDFFFLKKDRIGLFSVIYWIIIRNTDMWKPHFTVVVVRDFFPPLHILWVIVNYNKYIYSSL